MRKEYDFFLSLKLTENSTDVTSQKHFLIAFE